MATIPKSAVDLCPTELSAMIENLRPLDFIGIGAAKAGTTSLFMYLRAHPEVWLPPAKEIPYFSDDSVRKVGWQAYFERHFTAAPPDSLIGTVTPQYMADPRVPQRVAESFPRIKIIALLRDPADRAYSDWRMRARTGTETRIFEQAVAAQLTFASLERARQGTSGNGCSAQDLYIARSEYGRILESWYRHFDRQQICVQFSEELQQHTVDVMDRVTEFLELSGRLPAFKLITRYHKGGDRERFPGLLQKMANNRSARQLWRLFPFERRLECLRWFNWNVRFQRDRRTLGGATRKRLIEFFRRDVDRLEQILERTVPWEGYHD